MVKVAYTVGRFQPPTIGHKALIQAVVDAAGAPDRAYVFVSAVGPDKDKNPLPAELKLPILRNLFPKVNFIHTKQDCPGFKNCGGPSAAIAWLTTSTADGGKGFKPEEITFVVGKERLDPSVAGTPVSFGPERTELWEKAKPGDFLPVGASAKRDMTAPASDAANMSGTKARSYVTEDNTKKRDFYMALGYDPATPDPNVEAVYARISEVKFGTKTGGGEDSDYPDVEGGPDGELSGGRRKTRRVRRSKASGKALYRRGSRSRTGSSKTNRSSYALRGYSKGSSTW